MTLTHDERAAMVGDTVARDLWRHHKGAGRIRYIACLADIAVKAAEQPDFRRDVFREAVKALERLREADDDRPAAIH